MKKRSAQPAEMISLGLWLSIRQPPSSNRTVSSSFTVKPSGLIRCISRVGNGICPEGRRVTLGQQGGLADLQAQAMTDEVGPFAVGKFEEVVLGAKRVSPLHGQAIGLVTGHAGAQPPGPARPIFP